MANTKVKRISTSASGKPIQAERPAEAKVRLALKLCCAV